MSTKPGDQSTFDDSRDLTALPAYEPYPAWSVSHTLPDLVAQYGHLEPGTKATDAVVFAAGRITAKRDASKNLVFLDITADGCTVQVMASKGMYEGTAACQDGSDVQFRAMLGALRRGDVVGIRGIPGQSGKGELSLLPYEVVLLAPCQHNLPLPGQLRDPDLRFRRRYVDMLTNTVTWRGGAAGGAKLEHETEVSTALGGGNAMSNETFKQLLAGEAPADMLALPDDGSSPARLHDIMAAVAASSSAASSGTPPRSSDSDSESGAAAPADPEMPALPERNRAYDPRVAPTWSGGNVVSVRDRLLVRARVMRALRTHLENRGFLEVDTPVLQLAAGGASATPFETRMAALGDAPMALRIAPELPLKTLVIGGLDRVYELGRVFRNEGVSPVHNPEFTSLELYATYTDLPSLMQLTEELLEDTAKAALGAGCVNLQLEEACARAMRSSRTTLLVDWEPGMRPAGSHWEAGAAFLQERAEARPDLMQPHEDDSASAQCMSVWLEGPFRRVDVMSSLEAQLGEPLPDPNDPHALQQWEELLQRHGIALPKPCTLPRVLDKLIGEYLEPACVEPTFLVGHPLSLSPLAKEAAGRPGIADRFELFINGREIVNAYVELNDPAEQAQRFALQAAQREEDGDMEAQLPDTAFVTALEHGLPPTGGWGMGVDRFIMLLTGARHIREIQAFPVVRPKQ